MEPDPHSSRWYLCFFFSSRRRHTRLVSDWSSDVCSYDLFQVLCFPLANSSFKTTNLNNPTKADHKSKTCISQSSHRVFSPLWQLAKRQVSFPTTHVRSEERRVGKECTSRWARELRSTKRK